MDQREFDLKGAVVKVDVAPSYEETRQMMDLFGVDRLTVEIGGHRVTLDRAHYTMARPVRLRPDLSMASIDYYDGRPPELPPLGGTQPEPTPLTPPKGFVAAVALLAPVKTREQFMGDLEEAFHDNAALVGPRAAAWAYRFQVLRAAGFFIGARGAVLTGLAAVWKLIGGG